MSDFIKENMFARCIDRSELIHQAIGAGSMAWEHVGLAGVFDEQWALKVAREALERLEELDADS